MTDNPICREVADAYLTMTAADFDDWLAAKAADQPSSDYELIRSGYLAGNVTEAWIHDYATPELVSRSTTRGG
jgi:hypothetical protein